MTVDFVSLLEKSFLEHKAVLEDYLHDVGEERCLYLSDDGSNVIAFTNISTRQTKALLYTMKVDSVPLLETSFLDHKAVLEGYLHDVGEENIWICHSHLF